MDRWICVFLGCCLFGLTSCDEKRIFDEYESLPNKWHKDSVVSFTFKAPDTLKNYNLFINLRANSNYKYSNLFVITNMHFPKGKVTSDTLEYEMAKPSGELLGTGFGGVKESKLWYKENIRFSEKGTYKFTIRQAMRKSGETEGIENLEGITEVGFRIEKTIKEQ